MRPPFFFANAPPTSPLVGIGMNDFPVAPLPSPHSDCSLGGTGPREKLPICLGPRPHDMVRAGEVVCSTYTVSGLRWTAAPPPRLHPIQMVGRFLVIARGPRPPKSTLHIEHQVFPVASTQLCSVISMSSVLQSSPPERSTEETRGKKANNTKRNISYSPLILLSTFYVHTSPPP